MRFVWMIAGFVSLGCAGVEGTDDAAEPEAVEAAATAGRSVRFMQFNIEHAQWDRKRCPTESSPRPCEGGHYEDGAGLATQRLVSLANLIQKQKPDIVALEEVDVHMARSGGMDQAAVLSARTGLKHHTFRAAITRGAGEYGVALLSRFPIRRTSHFQVSNEVGERRIVMKAEVEISPNKTIWVAVTQLGTTSQAQRVEQADIIVKRTIQGDRDTVLMGDFNETSSGKAYERLTRGDLVDTWLGLGQPDQGPTAATLPSHSQRVDFVLVSRRWSLEGGTARTVQTALSEHYPVVVTLPLP